MNQIIDKYDRVAIFLHWFIAILFFALLASGFYMEDLPKGTAERTWWFSLHKSIGLSLFIFLLTRIVWRLYNEPPKLPNFFKSWQIKMAKYTHIMLYCLLVSQALSGYLSSSFSGYATRIWGVPLPQWGWKSPPLNELFTLIHNINFIILLLFIVFHVGATLYHTKRKDGILTRMLP